MSTGVKNLPIISTKRVGRIVKANTIPKKIIENTNKEILSVNGDASLYLMPGILPTTLSKALIPPPP